jgi:hypothetical protein
MRRVLELFLISAMVLGSALGAQEENGVLVLDVYSVNVPSDVIHEKGFALWAKALKGGEQSSHEYVPVIHSVYRLGGAVYIDKHYKTGEGNEEQISVVGRVNPEQGGVEYRVEFSELGRPPAYDGKTALTIGPRETGISIAGDRTRLCQKTRNRGGAPIPGRRKREWVKIEVRDQIAKEESTTNK